MGIENITNDWIFSEVEKLKYTYGLNKVIRYNKKREETKENETQSVAEHVYNMLILANYFRDLEDPEHKLDMQKVTRMILMHDMGEIETGDIVQGIKNQQQEEEESKAIEVVASKSPDFIKKEIRELFDEFENPKTPEGKFAKCIDKFESQMWWGETCDIAMVKTVNTAQQRMKNEEKRRKVYADCGCQIIAKFGKAIYDRAVSRGLIGEAL